MAQSAKDPIVENAPGGDQSEDLTARGLRTRIRQQELLAELGVLALQGPDFDAMLKPTARITAEGLETKFCKVLQHTPADNRLVVLAGVGWDEGIVGKASVGADLHSPAGFALRTGKPVISNHLENEQRFRTPELLVEHGIRRAMNVILQGDGTPFGVLEVDSESEGEFNERDVAFLQGAANILGMAIERQRTHRNLQAALDRHQVLLKEVNHRVKNSLQVVSSMLTLQANAATDPAVGAELVKASARVNAVGRAYERLAYNADYENIDLIDYLREIIGDLRPNVAPIYLDFEAPDVVQFTSDRAILLGLVINELVSNAARHAYPGGATGRILVQLLPSTRDMLSVLVGDEGIGLPEGFDPATSKRLGSRLVKSLVIQLGGEMTLKSSSLGTQFTLLIPLTSPRPADQQQDR